MKHAIRYAIRLLVVMALLLTSAVVFAQDETDTTTAIPFVGIRFMDAEDGVLVTGIITHTPAETAGLQPGDVITAINGTDVTVENVRDVVWGYEVDDTVSLTIDRNGREIDTDITLMARPDDLFNSAFYEIPIEPATLGLIVSDLDDELMIIGVLEGSQAQEAGFLVTDLITAINDIPVDSVSDALIAMSDLTYGDEVKFNVVSGQRNTIIRIIIIDRRRPVPPTRPREITAAYTTDEVTLGYGDNFILVQNLSETHEFYAAGVREGDYIIALNGQEINELRDIYADDIIEITVERGQNLTNYDVPVSVAPLLMFGVDAPQTFAAGEWLGLHEKQVTLGVRYLQLEAQSVYFADTDYSYGAYIAEVIEGLPAFEAGIQVGDVILTIDGEPVTMEYDLRTVIYAHKAGDVVTVEVLRNGETFQFDVTLRVANS